MKMSDRLSAVRARVRDKAESTCINAELSRDLWNDDSQNMRCQFPILFRELQNARNMLLRNDKNVLRRLRST